MALDIKHKDIVITYLKRNESDHPEREALAREIEAFIRGGFGAEPRLVNIKDMDEDPDFRGIVIGAGGDGLLLGSTYVFTHPDNQFLLVGAPGKSMAFYAQSDHKRYVEDIPKILTGDFRVLLATRLKIRTNDRRYESQNILNEVAIKEHNTGQLFRYDLKVEGTDIFKHSIGSSSTIIFATPMGSTAWGLAAGGSIIYSKNSKQVAITPESPVNSIKAEPFNLENLERDRLSFLAPGIFPLSCTISFTPRVDAVLIKDGRWWSNDHFPADTTFEIIKGDPLNLIILKEKGFYRMMRIT